MKKNIFRKLKWRRSVRQYGLFRPSENMFITLKKKTFLLFFSFDSPLLTLSTLDFSFDFFSSTFGVRKRRTEKWPPEYFHTMFYFSPFLWWQSFVTFYSWTKAADSYDVVGVLFSLSMTMRIFFIPSRTKISSKSIAWNKIIINNQYKHH